MCHHLLLGIEEIVERDQHAARVEPDDTSPYYNFIPRQNGLSRPINMAALERYKDENVEEIMKQFEVSQ